MSTTNTINQRCRCALDFGRLSVNLVAITIALFGLSEASAQDFPDGDGGDAPTDSSPPPDRLSVTETGVDMRTGRFAYSKTDLAVGALMLDRQISNDARGHLQPFGNMAHNWDIFIAERRFDRSKGLPPSAGTHGAGNDFQLFVHYGGAKQTFDAHSSSTGSGHSTSATGTLTVVGSRASSSALYTFEAIDGTLIEFRPIGSGDCSTVYRCAYVSKITRPSGEVVSFSYSTGGTTGHAARLNQVESSLGFVIRFEYGGSGSTWHQITKACAFNRAATASASICNADALQTVTYAYNSSKLTSVTDATGEIWQYGYPGSSMAFYSPGESSPYLTNALGSHTNDQLEVHDIVGQQVRGDGLTINYSYNTAPYQDGGTGSSDYPYYPSLAGATMTDSTGRTTQIQFGFPIQPGTWQGTYPAGSPINFGDVKYQTTSGPERIVDTLGRQWTMDYCDPAAAAGYPSSEQHRCLVTPVLQSFTDPEGNVTEYKYDGFRTRNIVETRRKAKPGSSLPDIVTTAVYDCTNKKVCQKPLSATDANGNVTNYTYSSVHGGVLTMTLPADASGVRPQTRYSYAQKYAWLKSGSGYVRASTPIWVLVSEEFCKTSAADSNGNCAAGSGDEVVTAYEYEQGSSSKGSNLHLLGTAVTADGQTLRTCVSYDDYGRQISTTQPLAGLASCQ